MDCSSPSLDQYEEQLYSMFKSFDVNNEEALDEDAVHELCDALQLEERGSGLVQSLFEGSAERVTFGRFRSGLLAVLGDEGPAAACPPEPPPTPSATAERRRSRPAQTDGGCGSPRAASASRLQAARVPRPPRPRRSASEAPAPLAHDARIGGEEALALCRDLRMDSIDRRLVERIFEDAPGADTTVGEFFERLDCSLARAADAERDRGERLTAATLLEDWERAGVARPRRLLAELGFATEGALPAAELERALDAELRAQAPSPPHRVLIATLVLARARGARARALAADAGAERDKLRGDVAEANSRAALLAREVDDSQARLEAELKEGLRRAEARRGEEERRARSEAEAQVERWAAERACLEAEAVRLGAGAARLGGELEAAEGRAAALEERLARAESALGAARTERAPLQERLLAAEEAVARAETLARRAADAEARLAELARTHRQLQDRADELAAALEAASAPPPAASAAAPDAALSTELGAALAVPRPSAGEAPTRAAEAEAECPRLQEEGAQANRAEAEAECPRLQAEGAQAEAECARLQELVRELEAALEAMRAEYEACEEYWEGKQRAERAAHEGELRAADGRLQALLARVADYERRMQPPAPPLHAIPEAAALEDQVAALQAEAAASARDAHHRLQRTKEALARAERRLSALQRRRAPPPPPPPPPCARCPRLEAAQRALASRLAAADMLVKDLFVENCQLARLQA